MVPENSQIYEASEQTGAGETGRENAVSANRLPAWLRRAPPRGPEAARMRRTVARYGLCTVCESATCPNRMECYRGGRLAFMILGDICTRNCAYCNVPVGKPRTIDHDEPTHIADAARDLGLSYVVVTSVCRDDLPDGGAGQFAHTIDALRDRNRNVVVEVLVPDFKGSLGALQTILNAHPSILNHNLETVPRLFKELRPQGDYRCSIELLRRAKSVSPDTPTKSGMMLGLGERHDEVLEVLEDLRHAGCDVITLGQYMRPSISHHPVERFLTPDEFSWYEQVGKEMGFRYIAAGPLVRSSYMAPTVFEQLA